MKKLMVIAVAALTMAAFAGPNGGPGRARRAPNGRGGIPMDPVVQMVTNPKIAEKIGLTEDQTKEIKAIDKANRADQSELRKQLNAAREKQLELLKAEKIDEAAVMVEIDKAFDAQKAMAKQQVKRIIAIKTILTPEQIAKALEEAKNPPPKRGKRGKGPKAESDDKPPLPPPDGCAEGCSAGGPAGCPADGPTGAPEDGDDKPPLPPPED